MAKLILLYIIEIVIAHFYGLISELQDIFIGLIFYQHIRIMIFPLSH